MELMRDWIVGFVDGEGCFYVGIYPHPEMSAGYQVLPEFRIVQHKRDIQILYALKRFFKSGVVRQNHEARYELRIRKVESLRNVVNFFEKHPLKTKKNVDFKHFARIIRMMEAKEHLNKEGIVRIIRIASLMNRENKKKCLSYLKKLENQDKDIVHLSNES